MKKVKLMLLSLSVLAVVGGALAFTAKNGNKVCYATVDDIGSECPATCPLFAILKSTSEDTFICSTTVNNGQCKDFEGTDLPCAAGPLRSTVE